MFPTGSTYSLLLEQSPCWGLPNSWWQQMSTKEDGRSIGKCSPETRISVLGKIRGTALYFRRRVRRYQQQFLGHHPAKYTCKSQDAQKHWLKSVPATDCLESYRKKTKPLSISFADNSGIELSYSTNEVCPVLHAASTFSEYKAAGIVRSWASNTKMENKTNNLSSSMQLYGIEKSFQQPQDMWTALENPDIKERYFPNFKWIQNFQAGGNCFSMQFSN